MVEPQLEEELYTYCDRSPGLVVVVVEALHCH
jgi:hypothetical protein